MTTAILFAPDKCVPASYCAHWFDAIRIDPGVNHYDDGTLDRLQSHPDYDRYVKWGAIKPVASSETVDLTAATTEELSLAAYSVDAAQELIAAAHDVTLLETWLASETRKTLRRDLNARITQIKSGNE
jgi:hypothetical protein